MTPRLRYYLWGLRMHGPCSKEELKRKLGLRSKQSYYGLLKLRSLGLAERVSDGLYRATDAGDVFAVGQHDETGPFDPRQPWL